ncbi:MAG: hypothetical protein BWX51_01753 [Bacteroidetes bacterium ADurb.Bin012]|jgi:hypothetical protein|nr:MAG: hypothetical protein BWX51_01753 [Bacteroidetes bacterium ADurb.Bin012]
MENLRLLLNKSFTVILEVFQQRENLANVP